jgi:hypothetical protein
MRLRHLAFSTRLTLRLAALLLACAGLIAVLGRRLAAEHEQASLQRLLHGLAQHIVGH